MRFGSPDRATQPTAYGEPIPHMAPRPVRQTAAEILASAARGAQRSKLGRAVRSAKREAYISSVTF